MTAYVSDQNIDTNSLELLFLYVEEFRMFKNASFNLNPKYQFSFSLENNNPKLNIEVNNNYVDLMNGLNLKVICGLNGIGKTTLIKLISGELAPQDTKVFIVCKDNEDNFMCNNQLSVCFDRNLKEVNQNYLLDYSFRYHACPDHLLFAESELCFSKNIARTYCKFSSKLT